LEVPGGTGIFTGIVLAKKKIKRADVIDISTSSLEYSKIIIELFSGRRDVKFYRRNIFNYNESQLYDYITCGELIEHVEKPLKILEILKKAVRPGGYIFLTTACFTAAIDHIYLFNNMDEVRKLISTSDLKCESELILPVSLEAYNCKKNRDPLNVAMILQKL
jgi:2-polyprenyl-3-methyl-5-hydroxy-6-metoxy-1,4-benzoquinol methylase